MVYHVLHYLNCIKMSKNNFSETLKYISEKHPEFAKHLRYLFIRFLLSFFVAISYCVFGGIIFRFLEGGQEADFKCGKVIMIIEILYMYFWRKIKEIINAKSLPFCKIGVRRVRRDFINDLWASSSKIEENDWKSSAREYLLEFEEQLHEAVEAGVKHSSSESSRWNLKNSIYYAASLILTLGRHHFF